MSMSGGDESLSNVAPLDQHSLSGKTRRALKIIELNQIVSLVSPSRLPSLGMLLPYPSNNMRTTMGHHVCVLLERDQGKLVL